MVLSLPLQDVKKKKKQCSNFWSNFRPFLTKLDHFRGNFNSRKWFFRRNGFRQSDSFYKMALDEMVLDEVSRIRLFKD